MNILITSGATREPVDGVRFISNFSTGRTAAALADWFAKRKHRVTYLHGIAAARPQGPVVALGFSDFRDLCRQLRRALAARGFDAVIHAAAVSDYSVAAVEADGRRSRPSRLAKLDSAAAAVTLRLRRNPKIIARLRRWSGGRAVVAGFKLTNTASAAARAAAVRRLGRTPGLDIVVHNDLRDMEAGARRFLVYIRGRLAARAQGAAALARRLEALIARAAAQRRRGHALGA